MTGINTCLIVLAGFLIFLGAYFRGDFSASRRKSLLAKTLSFVLPAGFILLVLATACLQSRENIPALNFLTPLFQFVFSLGQTIRSKAAPFSRMAKYLLPGMAVFVSILILIIKGKPGWKLALLLVAAGIIISGHIYFYEKAYLVGGMLTAAGIGFMFLYCRQSNYESYLNPSPNLAAKIILWSILLGGCLLRFYHLDILPYELLDYEATDGLAALQLLDKEPKIIKVFWTFSDRPIMDSYSCPFTAYPLAFLFSIFGPGIGSLRSVSALYGVLTVGMLYYFGGKLYSKKAGLIAALLLAVSPWSLTVSRIGLFLSFTPLYVLILIYFFYQAIETGKIRYYLLSAFLLSIYWLLYLIAKTLVLIILAILLYCLLTQHNFLKKNWKGLAFLFLGLIFFIYLFGDTPSHWFFSLGRQSDNTIWRLRPNLLTRSVGWDRAHQLLRGTRTLAVLELLLANIRLFFSDLYLYSRQEFLLVNRGPLVNPFLLAFLPLGIMLCLWRWKKKQYFLLVIWFLLSAVPQFCFMPTVGRGSPRHYLLLQPALYLLIALPLSYLLFETRLFRSRFSRYFTSSLTLLLVLILAVSNTTVYFQNPRYSHPTWSDRRQSAQYLNRLLDTHYLYIIQFPGALYLTNRLIDFLTFPKAKHLHYFLGNTFPLNLEGDPGSNAAYTYLTVTGRRVDHLPLPQEFPSHPVIIAFEDIIHKNVLEKKYTDSRLEIYRNPRGKPILYLCYPQSPPRRAIETLPSAPEE